MSRRSAASRAGKHPSVALGLLVLGLACRTSEEQPAATASPETSGRDGQSAPGDNTLDVRLASDGADGGVEPAAPAAASACASPLVRSDGIPCSSADAWGRNPDTGACCPYPSACVPAGWVRFTSESECQHSCRCERLEFPPGVSSDDFFDRVEHTSLDCACAGGGCPATLADEIQSLCAPTSHVSPIGQRGCGQIAVELGVGYVGSRIVFDEASGALVGRLSYSDVTSQCGTFVWAAGTAFACPDAQDCALCPLNRDPTLKPCN